MNLIDLYRVGFKVEKNPLIDQLDSYLTTLTGDAHTNFSVQYQKNSLNLSIKLPMDQSKVKDFDYNYAVIHNKGESKYYYYIVNTSWVAQNTIRIDLELDTVNTLNINNDLNPENFDSETHIIREHRDRYLYPESFTPEDGMILTRDIDRDSENIVSTGDLILHNKINDKDFNTANWFIMYKTREGLTPDNIANPLGIYVCSDTTYGLKKQTQGHEKKTYTVDDLENGYYYFLHTDNPGGHISCTGAQYGDRGGVIFNGIVGQDNLEYIVLKRFISHNTYPLLILYTVENKNGELVVKKRGAVGKAVIDEGVQFRTYGSDIIGETEEEIIRLVSTTKPINASSSEIVNLRTINNVDRTDSKLMKITEIPYCPIDLLYDPLTNLVSLPAGWVYDDETAMLKWEYQSLPQFIRNDFGLLPIVALTKPFILRPTDHDNKSVGNESKIYHSDFYTLKLEYANQSKAIPLERIKVLPDSKDKVSLDFKASNSASNGFMFKIDYNEDFNGFKNESEYDEYMLVERNNDLPILTSDYLNYIRNGYNYDAESNRQAIKNATINAAMSLAETGARIALPVRDYLSNKAQAGQKALAEANEKVDIFGINHWAKDAAENAFKSENFSGLQSLVNQQIVGAGFNAANSFASIMSTVQAQKNQTASKLAQLASQSTQLVGSGDVDLINWYSGNKLGYSIYEPREDIKRKVYNLFDKFGYSHDRYEVPNVTSRIWYNYIQCEPSLKVDYSYSLPKGWLDNFKERYQLGVTVYHKRNNEWNFNQDYENWESKLIGE